MISIEEGLRAVACELIATDGGTGLHQALQIVYPKIAFAALLGPQDQKRLGQSEKD